jgi:hypothetical protein
MVVEKEILKFLPEIRNPRYTNRVYDSRVLRRIVGSKRKEVVGGWRRLHSEDLHNLYTSPNVRVFKSRRIRTGNVACVGGKRNAYKIFIRKLEGKRLLRRQT